MSDISIRSDQEVGTNLGQMVAIKAGAINGNIHVEKISQIQIVTFSAEGRDTAKVIELDASPYVSLYPYTAANAPLFKGRDDEVKRIFKILRTQQVLVVYGHTGVGKTSLLAAGVMPKLAREGTFPILIQDYREPGTCLLEGLSAEAAKFSFKLPKEGNLPMLLNSIQEGVKGTVVLVLDQFELLFEPAINEEQRKNFIAELVEAITTINPNMLRVIISIRSYALDKLGELKAKVEKLFQCSVELQPLTRKQARNAIDDHENVIFDERLIEEQLLPDLDELTEEDPGFIHPQYLQLVCDALYRNASSKGTSRIITSKLYTEDLKGADGIVASFMRTMIKANVDDVQQDSAFQLLAVMASPGAPRWMRPSEFDLKDIDDAKIETILDNLVEARLLIQTKYDGKTYSLVSQMIAREFRQLSGTGDEVEKRYRAEDELERIWRAWLSIESYASREQLHYLTASGGHLRPRAVKTLLMLRSAVEAGEATDTWVKRLRGDNHSDEKIKYTEGKQLIEQIEKNEQIENNGQAGDQRIGKAMLVKAKRLLGFTDTELSDGIDKNPDANAQKNSSYGAVARKAVSADSPVTRQTCALALAAVDPEFAMSRLKAALREVSGSRLLRSERRAELFGSLADADQIAQLNSEFPLSQGFLIWRWRARRRVSRAGKRLAWLTLGGAIGAGLGVGLLRAILAVKEILPPGQEFGIFFFFAGSLGAALAYGMALSEPLQLGGRPQTHPKSWRSKFIDITLGTVFFGFVHLILAALNGLPFAAVGSYYVLLMGFVLGLGLSLSLSIQIPSEGGWLSKASASALRALVASVIFVLVSELFILLRDYTDGVLETQITRGSDYWKNVLRWHPWWLPPGYGNAHVVATLYSMLIAIFMVTGLTLGMKWAEKIITNKKAS